MGSGRRDSRFLCAGFPREDGRGAGALQHDVFRPNENRQYHFFCSQYCGTNHAVMAGGWTVMEPAEYAAWLSGRDRGREPVSAENGCSRSLRA